jgi:hypothetical protein
MTGETIVSDVTVTAGCGPSIVSPCPFPLMLVLASVVQLASLGADGAIAEKVNATLSPWFIADPPAMADTLIAVDDRLEFQPDDGVRIVTRVETVNSIGMAMLAEPKALVPVSVIVTVKVASWLMFTSVGDMVAVKRYVVFAACAVRMELAMAKKSNVSRITVLAFFVAWVSSLVAFASKGTSASYIVYYYTILYQLFPFQFSRRPPPKTFFVHTSTINL